MKNYKRTFTAGALLFKIRRIGDRESRDCVEEISFCNSQRR